MNRLLPITTLTLAGLLLGLVVLTLQPGQTAAAPADDQAADAANIPDVDADAEAAEARADADADAGPWLGLRVTPVPDALAAHLPLKTDDGRAGLGVMVINVVAGGPADGAGLRQYDVIVALDNKPVLDELGRFVRQIGGFEPGDKVHLTVLRSRVKQTLTLTVGRSKPARDMQPSWKYAEQPSGVYQEQANVRGTIIRRGESGWQWQDISQADPSTFADLPPEVRQRLEQVYASVSPIDRTIVKRGGKTVEIVRDPSSGSITVRTGARDDRGIQRVVARTYRDADHLRKADPTAFEVHQRIMDDPLFMPGAESGGAAPVIDTTGGPTSASPIRPDQGEAGEAEVATDDQVLRVIMNAEAYQQQLREYEQFLAEYTRYLKERAADPDAADQPLPMNWQELLNQANPRALQPQREFTVDESGRIDVRIRKAGGDLVISFRNEEEMQSMYPKLHEQYRSLLEGEADE